MKILSIREQGVLEKLKQKLAGKSSSNIMMSGLSSIANPLLQIIATPLIFHSMGSSDYGAWAIINTVLGVAGIATLGLGDAATKYVALYEAKGDSLSSIKVIRTVLSMYTVLGIAMAIVLFFLAGYISTQVLHYTGDKYELGIVCLRISAVGIILRFLYGVFEATLRGYHRYDLESKWAISNSLLTTTAAIVVTRLGGGLGGIIVMTVLILGLSLIGIIITTISVSRNWQIILPLMDRNVLKEVASFGIFTMIQTLNGVLLHQVDRIVIGIYFGSAVVGYYAVCLQVVQTLHGIVARSFGFLFPLVVRLRESEDYQELKDIFTKSNIATTLFGIVVSGAIFCFSYEILQVWMGNAFADKNAVLLSVLAIWNIFLSTTVTQFYFLNASGGESANAVFGFICSLLFLIMSLILIPFIGTIAIAWARVASVSTGIVSRYFSMKISLNVNNRYAGVISFMPVIILLLFLFPSSHWSGLQLSYGLRITDYVFSICIASIACIKFNRLLVKDY